MSWIEGIGDEVVQFGVIVLFIIIVALAWISTSAMPDYYRTMLVMRSRGPVSVSIRTSNETQTAREENASNNAQVIPLQEMDSIVDADMAMMDNNRLHFYRRIDERHQFTTSPSRSENTEISTGDESEVQDRSEESSNAQIREMNSIVSAMEADVTAAPVFSNPTGTNKLKTENHTEQVLSSNLNTAASKEEVVENRVTDNEAEQRKISIKLKFLNESSKQVEGSLDELLKDFKWRHFPTEMSSGRRVRLIFNGRALAEEAATLRTLGLHHNAVVHCLVYPNRGAPAQANPTEEVGGGRPTQETAADAAQPERTWDLENILMTLISVALTVVWFFRCEYSNMFTASASVALIGLTIFYSVAIFGLYLSDNFNFDRRPQTLHPN